MDQEPNGKGGNSTLVSVSVDPQGSLAIKQTDFEIIIVYNDSHYLA